MEQIKTINMTIPNTMICYFQKLDIENHITEIGIGGYEKSNLGCFAENVEKYLKEA